MSSTTNDADGAQIAALPLGKPTAYPQQYDPHLLQVVPRRLARDGLDLDPHALPFSGGDDWTAYELSWLDRRGKPVVAIGRFHVPCTSPNLIESKSLKLYLNSFNQTRLDGPEAAHRRIAADLSERAGETVRVDLVPPQEWSGEGVAPLPGECIDGLEIEVNRYQLEPDLLRGAATGPVVDETLHSHLLKSNCLVTHQPDWASVLIRYRGPRIDRAALLRYLISYRQHSEFHEPCVERIFAHLLRYCTPRDLTVYARYTRRGGLDINPFRSNFEAAPGNARLARQ